MQTELMQIIENVLTEINALRKEKIPLDNLAELALYGTHGVFDSMQLVNFLAAVEEALEDELDLEISLTSEKAVSRKVSPFSSVTNLVAFILDEQGEHALAAG